MMTVTNDLITELNQCYNDLGDDLLLLQAVILALRGENQFSQECVASSLERMTSAIEQHLKDIHIFAGGLVKNAVCLSG